MRNLLAISLIASASAAAFEAFAAVPERDAALIVTANGATFTAERPDGAAPISIVANGDGARLVACGAAVVSAAHGARAKVSCGDSALLSLEDGAFRITAGSHPIRIVAGDAHLALTNARLEIAFIGGRWLARLVGKGEAGGIAAEGFAREFPPEELVALGAEVDAPARDLAAFETASKFAAPAAEIRRALIPRRVEKPLDEIFAASAAQGGAAEVELEAIEVEAGCIEVCVD